jgi:hypothetical protein
MRETKLLLKELQYLKQEAQDTVSAETVFSVRSRFSSWQGKLLLFAYKSYLCGFSTMDSKIKALEAQVESLSAEIEQSSKEEHESTGLAVIIFNHVQVRSKHSPCCCTNSWKKKPNRGPRHKLITSRHPSTSPVPTNSPFLLLSIGT